MPALSTFQGRVFGPAASTITLATKGGAVLGGVWISAKGTTPVVAGYDQASATLNAGTRRLASCSPAAVGLIDVKGIEFGLGMIIKVSSCTGTILWRPSSAGV